MSSLVVNENQGVCSVQKLITSDTTGDIFALNHPTGRPSILRQSQADNISKNMPRGVKVCFQTPLRDPVTRKIMSPSRVGRMDSLDDSSQAVDSLPPSAPSETKSLQCGPVAQFDCPSKSISPYPDDDMPVKGKGGYVIDFDNLESMNPFQGSGEVVPSPPKPSALPEQPDVVTLSTSVHEEVVKVSEDPGQVAMALDETLPFTPSVENSLVNLSVDTSDNAVIIEPKNSATHTVDHGGKETENLEISKPAPTSDSCSIPEDTSEPMDSPVPPKGSYKIDFDLDSVNPFQTGGSKIQNSPLLSRKTPVSNSPPCKAEDEVPEPKTEPAQAAPEVTSILEMKPPDAGTPSVTESAASAPVQPKDRHVLLEFNFDGAEVKCKPPPRQLGVRRPPGSKPAAKEPPSALPEERTPEPKLKPETSNPQNSGAPVDVPVARGAYSLDFDDPNFNPFGTTTRMGSSPPSVGRSGPVLSADVQAETQKPSAPAQSCQLLDQCCGGEDGIPSDYQKTAENELPLTMTEGETMGEVPRSPANKQPVARVVSPKPHPHSQCAEFEMVEAEVFVPGSMFVPNDLDGQIDYLEQFGSTVFKESALRKQSLYLNFDPLLKESPKKAASDGSTLRLLRPSLAIRMMEAARSEVKQKVQHESTKLLDDIPSPADLPAAKDPTELHLLAPTIRQAQKSEDFIVDVLKYSQKDMDAAMDAAMETARKEAEEKDKQLEKLRLDNQHMSRAVLEFEGLIAQINADRKLKEELAQAELSAVLQEKQLLAKNLSDMERFVSDVFQRLDKHKEVINGLKKNEETMKQCTQNYLDRLQKEEQRYQKLKTHTEEEIDQANKEIAEVRSKMEAEVSTLQVQLKREQLKVQSLEKNLEQKTKEVEDVTKLCDELIMKVQKQ